MIIPIIVIVIISALIAWRWVEGIDYMQKNHPDYKGEDFLDWGEESAPWETEKKKNEKNI